MKGEKEKTVILTQVNKKSYRLKNVNNLGLLTRAYPF